MGFSSGPVPVGWADGRSGTGLGIQLLDFGGHIEEALGPLHEQSHGESFLALLLNRFHGEGLYLLDEPEAALSPSWQLSVITRMHDLVQEKSQFIIATHSPILMAYPHAYIYAFSPKGIERVAYKD